MKDCLKLKDYRLKYKRYYGIDFDDQYDIHHIDLDHNNNDINNLLLLPKKLHRKYHFYLNMIRDVTFTWKIHSSYNCQPEHLYTSRLQDFLEVLNECNKWYDYKLFLDGILPNIHRIEVN